MARKRVLVTGATGYIAQQLLPAFRERYDLRLTDVRKETRDGVAVPDVEILDLLDDDPTAISPFLEGIDTIVHLGFVSRDEDAPYESQRRNVDMMQRVYQAATESGVGRVVAASTNQAAKWYEQPWFAGRKDIVSVEDYPRPESFYGWAKAAYESLGFVYACGGLGTTLEVVLLRIVVPREIDPDLFVNEPRERYIRELAGYISERDLQQLFIKSIDARSIDDQHGIPFQIFNGVSNNARKFWSITNARQVVDYQPVDDSEVRFAKDIARLLG
ncbi:MAG TPA: NAD(P)-dependent oxidoreductase [Thermomicrobiales bacterium]|nr:NAD(P)-dependent oxidoreductase [Thermomicrobiales bacterium]